MSAKRTDAARLSDRAGELRHCTACGIDRLGDALQAALAAMGVEPGRLAIVHAGGCAAEAVERVEAERHRVPLGAALPFALGLQTSRPELFVIVLLGDGDAAGVGGNHLLHAARRGDPVRALVVNNEVLSSTGGFPSPTTPRGGRTPATPRGSTAEGLDLCALAHVAGAAWVGREVIGAGEPLHRLLREFLAADPFAFLEVRAPCFPVLGPMGGYATPEAMLDALERRAVRGGAPVPAEPERFSVGRLWPPAEESR